MFMTGVLCTVYGAQVYLISGVGEYGGSSVEYGVSNDGTIHSAACWYKFWHQARIK